MNYKKSILSLATILALGGTAAADGVATYLPLTTPTKDGSWILFGVNGLSDGTPSARAAVAEGFSADFVEVEDTVTTDALATWLSVSGAAQPADDNILAVQGIDDVNLGKLKVAVKIIQPYEEREPIRSMYIRLNSATPNVKIDYKSSLEGQTLELMLPDSSTKLYSVVINEDNTYSNAAIAVESVPETSTIAKLDSITDVLDFQFADNPLDARYYSKEDNLDNASSLSVAAKTAEFYHFDSVSQQWKVWNVNLDGVANDFTTFSKGDAYWGRIDADDAVTALNNDGTVGSGITDNDGDKIQGSGLVLGESNSAIPDSSVYANKLTSGWNMLALDDTQPYVRRAATGLYVEGVDGGAEITITDSSGINSIAITLTDADDAAGSALEINAAIESAKLKRTLPKSFNVRAYRSDATHYLLISDAKFTLQDSNADDAVNAVTTLIGDNPYSELGTQTTAIDNLDETGANAGKLQATSAYGEYAVIADVLTSDLSATDVAATLDSEAEASANGTGGDYFSAKVAFGTATKDYTPIEYAVAADADPSAANAKTQIEAHPLFDAATEPTASYGKAYPLDSLNDGSADKMIIASSTPFYMKDATYTRVFEYQTNGDASRKFSAEGTVSADITPANPGTATNVAVLLSDVADTTNTGTGIFAKVDNADNTKIIAVSTTLSTFDLKDLEDGSYEFLKATTSDSNLAKGAVAGVYALDTVAQIPLVQYKWETSGFSLPAQGNISTDDTILFNVTTADTGVAVAPNAALVADVADTAARLAWFDAIVADMNTQLDAAGLHGEAYHDYVAADDNLATAKVTVTGMDVSVDVDDATVANDMVAPTVVFADANAATVGTQGTSWTSLISDLKTNAIYTPNYAVRGPLYTMRDAGYDVRAILKATTDVADGQIVWDSIDLTRDESAWFKNNEFNMFTTNIDAGYWVYLEPKSADSLNISNAGYTATYTYYFDNKDSNDEYLTKNVINGGQFTVNITGFDGEINSAYVTVNGEEIQLKRNGISNEYTADFTKYSLKAFNEGGSGDISMTVRATNGKGESLTASDSFAFDYTAPTLNTTTVPSINSVTFSADGNATKFHVFNEYIPELAASRSNTDTDVSRVVGSYTAVNSTTTTNICSALTFGEVNNLRVIAADGTGEIGFANLSNAEQFTYAPMLKGAQVLTDVGGDTDKAIIGLRYNDSCDVDANQPATAEDNTGISLKTIESGQTARLSYEEIDGVESSLSNSWLSSYSIGGDEVIQVQNLEEYAGKPFYLEYGGKMYISAFPSSESDSEASIDTPIKLDNTGTFTLTSEGVRDTTVANSTGNEISIVNNSLAP